MTTITALSLVLGGAVIMRGTRWIGETWGRSRPCRLAWWIRIGGWVVLNGAAVAIIIAGGVLFAQSFPRDAQFTSNQGRTRSDSPEQQQIAELMKHMHDQELLNVDNTAIRTDVMRRLADLEKTLREVKPDLLAYQLASIQEGMKEIRTSIDHLVMWFLGFVGLGGGGVVYYRNKRNEGGSLDK